MMVAVALATWLITVKCQADESLLLVCKSKGDELCATELQHASDIATEKKCSIETKILD